MITVRRKRETVDEVSLTDEEAKTVTVRYIQNVVIGKDCYITKDGKLEHWTSYPHGSGTTTDKGKPTAVQTAAAELLARLAEAG